MNPPALIPQIPENAPFSIEQRAYLNGFLAGLFSRTTAPSSAPTPAAAPSLMPLTIVFGSQTGTAEKLAKRASKEATKRGFAPVLHDMASTPIKECASSPSLMVITSTYGDGEPPDTAKSFWEGLNSAEAPHHKARYTVCALGDTNYPKFCAFGKSVDARLEALGAHRILPCAECDTDYEAAFAGWLDKSLKELSAGVGQTGVTPSGGDAVTPVAKESAVSGTRECPYPSALLVNRLLNGEGSAKETRHFEFELTDPTVQYQAGDALGVIPSNCPALVSDLISTLHADPEEIVPVSNGLELSLFEALSHHFEITRIPKALIAHLAVRTREEQLVKLTDPNVNGELSAFLRGREIIDLLLQHPGARTTARELVAMLRRLQPRLYSISSSPKAHPKRVHLTVGIVRYESLGRQRKGVCSTFLAERAGGSPVPIFVHRNDNFRPPADPKVPMIMVGPGTGIAPFRAFLQERSAGGAQGRNWLFFGDQRSSTDFLYREELQAQKSAGILNRLDLAFSRDQDEKIYVQQRMLENARELFNWLEDGAHFYVCGDASRMAKDVDAALHRVIEIAAQRNPDQAREYVNALKTSKRYQRDVY
ncbi:MAG: sulfite reductase subunit alpha [Verrucomicrobia bacterium]|nr:sulfite reductase subunit alpha [Verrucomicrobiota bacterium]